MHDEPRIGLVAPLPPQIGGVASFAEWLLEHRREIGCTYDTFDLWRHPEDDVGGRVTLRTVGRQVGLLARYVRWVRSAPQVIHYCVAWTPTGFTRDLLFLTVSRLSRRRVIANLHVVADVGRRRAFALRMLARLTTDLITTTQTGAESLGAAGAPARWISNPLRIEPNGRRPSSTSSALRLLFVGRYGAAKGAPDLVAALAGARTNGVDAILRFVGRELYAGDEASLRDEIRELGLDGSIEFAGVLPPERLRSCYEEADVICLPSHREGLPMVLLEGMAFGLPVLATPVGGIPDLVTDGEDGFLVEPGDVEALRAAIEALAASPERRTRMGASARARVHAVTDPTAVARRWHDAYARSAAR